MLTEYQLAALEHNHHISLTANAGSGKTFVLAKRYVKIAYSEGGLLKNIVAITFTDKAASELYKKIVGEIDRKINLSVDKNERFIYEKMRRHLVSANISTIHSFCSEVLHSFPVEADLDANFTTIDEQLSDELIELSVSEVIKSSFDQSNANDAVLYLVRILGSINNLSKELRTLLKNRKTLLSLNENIYSKTVEEIASYFYDCAIDFSNRILSFTAKRFISSLSNINQAVLEIDSSNEIAVQITPLISKLKKSSTPEEFFAVVHKIKDIMLVKGSKVRTQKYLSKAEYESSDKYTVEEIFSFYKYIVIDTDHRKRELELAEFGKNMMVVFFSALENYERKKKENGYLDFEDILIKTKNLLENKYVKAQLISKYKYIMVDEYQDTNEIQYNIILPILDHLKSGNLFIIGDDKQSIYKFRDAELEVFNRTRNDISNVAGSECILTLPDSFRMSPEICAFVNYTFSKIFDKPNPLFNEVKYSEIICATKPDANNSKGEIELLCPINEENDSIENAPADRLNPEAELVAKKILEIKNSFKNKVKLDWSDIAVLTRKRKHFAQLEKAFVRYNIPYSVIGGRGFFQNQIVADVYNFLSFLLDQNNDLALVGILRSPFFMLSDSELYTISLQKGFTFFEKLNSAINTNEKLKDILFKLNEYLRLINNAQITILLRKIFEDTAYLATVSSKRNGKQILSNLEKLIRISDNFNRTGLKNLYDLVEYLKDSIENDKDFSQAEVSYETDTVNIITLHQAKGLEFKAVFLFKSNEKLETKSIKSKNVTVDKKFGLLTKLPVDNNYFDEYGCAPVVGINNLIENKKEIAELKRLFYVGVTRAINYLYISAEKIEGMNNSNSFIGLLSGAIDIGESNCIKIKYAQKILDLNDLDNNRTVRDIELNIPVVNKINIEPEFSNTKKENQVPKKLLVKNISDLPEGEIISATKMAVYNQCPLKYQFTYNFGLNYLQNQFGNFGIDIMNNKTAPDEYSQFEETDNDDNVNYKSKARFKGTAIHKLLQIGIDEKIDKEFVKSVICNSEEVKNIKEENIEELILDISTDINNLLKSSVYLKLNSHQNFKNEYEVYLKEKDYYLYGIIDKLIITDEIIIVDYKTDDIPEKQIFKRAEEYFKQLTFYCFIVSNIYKNYSRYTLKLIFVKHPEINVEKVITKDDLEEFRIHLYEMVKKIRANNFSKNLNHCNKCAFAINGNVCIRN